LGRTHFFKQEILEVPDLLTALLITYDGIRDDTREIRAQMTWNEFLDRMSRVKPDWKRFDRRIIEALASTPEKTISGHEGRTFYFIRGGSHPEQWTPDGAAERVFAVLASGSASWAGLIQMEMDLLRTLPAGQADFSKYENIVRIAFNFLFRSELGQGQSQSRTEPENEGIEIRDLVFANKAASGFWKDLKDKYSASEIVVDAKNKNELTREDLRQLYCYLKPALGLWGFIVSRCQPAAQIEAFNRTLFKNFSQQRGVLLLSDDDLCRMVTLANRGKSASEYLRERMSEFVRSV
jgi:hypothetical protein